jgi:hypothetical protein
MRRFKSVTYCKSARPSLRRGPFYDGRPGPRLSFREAAMGGMAPYVRGAMAGGVTVVTVRAAGWA